MKVNRLVRLSLGLIGCVIVATGLFLGLRTPTSATVIVTCAQPTIVAAEHGVLLLNPDEANVAIPQGEPQIVAVVNGQSITAKQLEMLVQTTLYNNQTTLASLGGHIPPTIQGELTRSPAALRQMLLTNLIDNDLWLSQGKHSGEYASVADAQKLLKQSLATFHHIPASSPAYIEFTAFLCANHLSETSYQTDARVIQQVQDRLTIAAAKAHVASKLSTAQQHNDAAVKAAENTYVQSLWAKNSVQVFLTGFTPLRV